VWGSVEDFGSARFLPAEPGTPCLVEGTPNRGLRLGIVGMGNRGFDGIRSADSERDFDGPLTRASNRSSISGEGVPALAGGDLVGLGVWVSVEDLGPGRFPPA
jgi:hypothetical protein